MFSTEEESRKVRLMVEEQKQNMNLSVVRLCFQAYLPDEGGCFTKALPPCISNAVYDSSECSSCSLELELMLLILVFPTCSAENIIINLRVIKGSHSFQSLRGLSSKMNLAPRPPISISVLSFHCLLSIITLLSFWNQKVKEHFTVRSTIL